jgi:hypothetical protein
MQKTSEASAISLLNPCC